MLSEATISRLVCGIAAQYAKDLYGGRGWSEERFKEYRQELFLEAYKLLKANQDIAEPYLATSLFNRAKEVYNKEQQIRSHELSTELFEDDDNAGNTEDEIRKVFWQESVIKSEQNSALTRLDSLVLKVLELSESQDNDDLRVFIIAKLKLCGYVPSTMYPDVPVDLEEYDQAGIAENRKILEDFFNMTSAFSGGTNKFKNSKRNLFLNLLSEFELDDSFKRRFEVKYIDKDGKERVEAMKRYSEFDIHNYLTKTLGAKQVLSVILEE